MLLARIARPGAAFDASDYAKTFESFAEFHGNESDWEEEAAELATEAQERPGYAHMPGFPESQQQQVSKVNIARKMKKKREKKKTRFKVQNILYLQKKCAS